MNVGRGKDSSYGPETQKGQAIIKLFLRKVQGQPNPINPGLLTQNGCQQLLDSSRRGGADLKPGQEDVGP